MFPNMFLSSYCVEFDVSSYPAKTRLLIIVFWLLSDLPLESCGCYVLSNKVSTSSFYYAAITYSLDIVITALNQNSQLSSVGHSCVILVHHKVQSQQSYRESSLYM